jgi:hypothetical protein
MTNKFQQLANWNAPANRRDPLEVLGEQEEGRIPWLLPIRHGRMAANLFAHMRGSAATMAADLSSQPNSGVLVQLCGDAHLLNFGFYASPERSLLFDIVDFDETYPGPFEWDLKRLLVSLYLTGREHNLKGNDCLQMVRRVARHYRKSITELAQMPLMQMWAMRVDVEELIADSDNKGFRHHLEAVTKKARERDTLQAAEMICTTNSEGHLIFRHEPPELWRHGLLPAEWRGDLSCADWNSEMEMSYSDSMPSHVQQLLSYFHWRDWALKAVGVASVGTRCAIGLWTGTHQDDVLILQCKEARKSVLQAPDANCPWPHQGQRVVEGQRLMQTASDAFLGWSTTPEGHNMVWRHFRDWKGSVVLNKLDDVGLELYGKLCAWVLAKAHARSSKATPIANFIDKNDNFDDTMANFSATYSEQAQCDYKQFLAAIEAGQLVTSEA